MSLALYIIAESPQGSLFCRISFKFQEDAVCFAQIKCIFSQSGDSLFSREHYLLLSPPLDQHDGSDWKLICGAHSIKKGYLSFPKATETVLLVLWIIHRSGRSRYDVSRHVAVQVLTMT